MQQKYHHLLDMVTQISDTEQFTDSYILDVPQD
jgi:hypothetical protein